MPQFTEVSPHVFLWPSTCNCYVLRDGDAALLIDLGDGTVLDHLKDIGVKSVEWVLFTHHHREQCQGAAKLKALKPKIAVPAAERSFFEQPTSFRKMRPTLNDPFAVYGTSFVRPPVEPIAVDHVFKKMDDFTWRGHEFWCIDTPGNSPGHMAYMLRDGNRWLAFTGDLMVAGAKMHTWFDSEWDYGFATGLYALGNSAAQVAGYDPALLLPAHGTIVRSPRRQLDEYVKKLRRLGDLYVRGYDINRFANCDQDNVSRPSLVPHVWQVSPHLYKFRGPNYWVNFAMILADSGRALFVDCGLFDRSFLDQTIERMKEKLGLKAIDAIFVTHMHGDHALDADHVRTKYGAKLWTMEGVADKFERPFDYDLSALLPFYSNANKETGPLKFDRVIKNGEVIEWEGYSFVVDWMPGQTKYHACLHGQIDGRRVAFTGDNIFASTTDPKQGGNECVLARNGGTLEEGYLYAASYLHDLGPDLLIGGHCWVLDHPAALIERFRQRMLELRECYQSLSAEDDYRLMFDPYWVQAYPYRVTVKPGESGEVTLKVRNYHERKQSHRIQVHAPPGFTVEPTMIEATTAENSLNVYPLKIHATKDAPEGVHIIAFDVTVGGKRYGEWFDMMVQVGDKTTSASPAPMTNKPGVY